MLGVWTVTLHKKKYLLWFLKQIMEAQGFYDLNTYDVIGFLSMSSHVVCL